jgi:hypothetical protein
MDLSGLIEDFSLTGDAADKGEANATAILERKTLTLEKTVENAFAGCP